MAFSWESCTVITNSKNKKKATDCYKTIYEFSNCLTPNVIAGLRIWISNKMYWYGAYRIKSEDVRNDIAELLRNCCHTKHVTLLMHRDVLSAEPEIIMQIKKSIDMHKYRGIYQENLPLETYEDYNNRQIVTPIDVENYLRGVPIFD